MADLEEMNMAAESAAHDLKQNVLAKLSPEELAGVKKVYAWIRKHYLTAGYKRLMKVFFAAMSEQK